MGYIYYGFSTVAGLTFVALVALSIACGLYFLAEVAEEHPSKFKLWLQYALVGVLGIHVLLMFDGLPLFEIAVGIVCHLCYASMMQRFPFVELTSLPCLVSLIAIVIDHYIWFAHFSKNRDSILQVMGFFLIMIWIVPFGLFIGLTVNDNILPGIGPDSFHGITHGSSDKPANLFRSMMNKVMEWRNTDDNQRLHIKRERMD